MEWILLPSMQLLPIFEKPDSVENPQILTENAYLCGQNRLFPKWPLKTHSGQKWPKQGVITHLWMQFCPFRQMRFWFLTQNRLHFYIKSAYFLTPFFTTLPKWPSDATFGTFWFMTRSKVCWFNVKFDDYVNGEFKMKMALFRPFLTRGSTFLTENAYLSLPDRVIYSRVLCRIWAGTVQYVTKLSKNRGILGPILTTVSCPRPILTGQPEPPLFSCVLI